MKEKKPLSFRALYLITNAALVAALLLFLLLDRLDVFDKILICTLHLIGIYCPTCGITRATHALLRLDPLAALRYNPCIFPLLALVLYYEICALRGAILNDKAPLTAAKRWPALAVLGLFGVFFIVRNVLLVFGLDPTGDFLAG